MFGINKNGTKHKIGIAMPSFFPSSRVTYDNTQSGLTSTDVQDAIDELVQSGGGSIDIQRPTFTEASTRANIESGETISTLFGKIKKFFTDLATVAFSGKSSDLNNDAGFITSSGSITGSSGSCTGNAATATKATQDADGNDIRQKYVNVYNSANVGGSSSVTVNDLANQGSSVGMIYAATDNPYGSAGWIHAWSQAWAKGANTSWVSQIALGVANGTGMWYRTNSGTAVGRAWTRVIDSSNIGSQSVSYATRADIANSASSATTASNATYAQSATSASSSNYATSAGYAGYIYSNTFTICQHDGNNGRLNTKSGHHLLAQDDKNLVWYSSTNSVIWQSGTSSRRFKHNIQSMTEERARKILQIRAVTFDWNDNLPISTQKCDNAGVIAEEVSQVIPDVVVFEDYDNDPNVRIERRVEYERFTPYLIKMVQMQQKQIDTMQATINALEQRLSKLEGK